METKHVYVKTRGDFGKQCIFDVYGPNVDEDIKPNLDDMRHYVARSHCHAGVQHSRRLAFHEVQTAGAPTKNSGMFHFEGGWPKEINPRDEEVTARFRRRVEKDDDWAPKLRKLFEMIEHNVLQNGALNIHEHYFDDMVPTEMVKPRDMRTVNVFADPQVSIRPISDISWSSDSGHKIAVCYSSPSYTVDNDYSSALCIWQIENPNVPCMTLEAFHPAVVSEFNPRDPSVLAGGLTSGQVCNWDTRRGTTPVQMSQRLSSHRYPVNGVKWLSSKTNTEFFSSSSDGRAMWWDTRRLREPFEVLIFDLETPNEPSVERAMGISSMNFEPLVATKFMFGMDNGVVISGSRKGKTPAEKLATKFSAHYGPVVMVDRNIFNPKIFLTVGDWTARVWSEDTKEGNLVSTCFLDECLSGGCWNRSRHSIFYVITRSGRLMTWDILEGLHQPILTIQLCEQRLTTIAAHEEGALLAVGNSVGKVFLVESTESLLAFDKNEKNNLAAYLERCGRFAKAIDTRLKELKLVKTATAEGDSELALKDQRRRKSKPVDKMEQDKREIPDKSLKPAKEKKRSVVRDKRRMKDEFPELLEVEERYFEAVQKEKERWELEGDPFKLSIQAVASARRRDSRRSGRKTETMDEAEPTPEAKERTPRKRKPKVVRSKSESSRAIAEEKTEITEPAEVFPAEAPTEKTTSRGERRKKKEKKRREEEESLPKKSSLFRLPKPCKTVCRPRVCCRKSDSTRKLRRKGTEEAGKSRITNRTVAEILRGEDKARDFAAKVSAGRKREEQPRKYTKGEKIRILREMMVREARREIQEARRLTGKAKREAGVRRIMEKRAKGEAQRQKSRKLKKDDEFVKIQKSSQMREKFAVETVKRDARDGRESYADPCSPTAKPTSVVQEFEALVGEPLPKTIEEQPKRGRVYLEEIEAARSRVYPWISEFHSIE